MIVHAVFLLPKPETTHEELQHAMELAKALQHKIPGIIDVQAGKNINVNNQGYTYGMLLRFEDEEALKAYFPHPEHRAVGAELRRISVNLMNFDLPLP